MKGINYVTNDKGEKVAVIIDLKEHDKAINQYIEDLEDLIDLELRKDEQSIPWNEAKKRLS